MNEDMRRMICIVLAAAAVAVSAGEARAQMGKKNYINAGWQFNGTVGNDFVQSAQGYGAYMEGGYYLTPMVAVGGFASFNTNNEYVPRRTYVFADQSALTTDLYHSLYQVPFGSVVRMRFLRDVVQPYAQVKIGTEYAVQSVYMSTFVGRQDSWGFYVSPELGVTVFPFEKTDFGFHMAVFYSYSANKCKSYCPNGLNNVGFKLGIAF